LKFGDIQVKDTNSEEGGSPDKEDINAANQDLQQFMPSMLI